MATVKINVYKSGGKWFGACWIGDEYDSCNALDVADDADENEARGAAYSDGLRIARETGTPHNVEIARVDDA